jgi:hypothetical protein
MDKFKSEYRYFVRWRVDSSLVLLGWDICDREKFDKIEVAMFGPEDRAEAVAICKLLNSNEEIERGLSK